MYKITEFFDLVQNRVTLSTHFHNFDICDLRFWVGIKEHFMRVTGINFEREMGLLQRFE